jgi:LDH2 family malate/lactate/ureidoglycolate dehydrogenase
MKNGSECFSGLCHAICHSSFLIFKFLIRGTELPTLTADQLTAFVTAKLEAAGVKPAQAAAVARSLVDANLAGYDSHGVQRLLTMLRNIRQGRVKVDEEPFVLRETPVIAVVDGAWTFGQVGARFASELAARKAGESGLAAVSLVRSHHTGRMAEWVEIGARAGLFTMAVTATGNDLSAVVPTGGATGALGTNPMGWGIPRSDGEAPIIVDFSTGATSIGNVQLARARGELLPEGLIVDADGRDTSDPADFFNGGSILPMGGHKGYALSIVIEMLAIALGGGDQVPTDQHSQSLLVICIDPNAFWPQGEWAPTVERIARRIIATPPASDAGRVRLPGEGAAATRANRLRDGIPIPDATWEALTAAPGAGSESTIEQRRHSMRG